MFNVEFYYQISNKMFCLMQIDRLNTTCCIIKNMHAKEAKKVKNYTEA